MNVTARRSPSGVYLVDADRGGVVGLVSNLQWAILTAAADGCDRRQLGAAVYSGAVQTAAQRAALSRSIRRLEALGLLAAGAITEEGRDWLSWLARYFDAQTLTGFGNSVSG